jgi:hypothetical protein
MEQGVGPTRSTFSVVSGKKNFPSGMFNDHSGEAVLSKSEIRGTSFYRRKTRLIGKRAKVIFWRATYSMVGVDWTIQLRNVCNRTHFPRKAEKEMRKVREEFHQQLAG